MLSLERQTKILEAVRNTSFLATSQIAKQLNISVSTARRDLTEMESRGLIRRLHGGAVVLESRDYELPFIQRENENLEEKQAIGRSAWRLIERGDTIFLDVSSTTLQIAHYLKKRRDLEVTVLTNSLRIAMELLNRPGIEVLVLGGKVKASEFSLVGPLTQENSHQFHVKRAFLGAGGVHVDHGLTTYDMDEAEVKKSMINSSKEVCIVVDHTKLGAITFAWVCPLRDIDRIITDERADPQELEKLKEVGMEVIISPLRPTQEELDVKF